MHRLCAKKGHSGCQPAYNIRQMLVSEDRSLYSKRRGRQGKWSVAVLNLRKFSSGGYRYPDHYTIQVHLEYYQSYDLSRELARGPVLVYLGLGCIHSTTSDRLVADGEMTMGVAGYFL